MMKRLVSGVKPTGEIHIGNYFGALRQFVDLQESFETFIFIADYHALNQVTSPSELNENISELAKAFLAVGLDPEKAVLFRQSDVPAHTELCWILNSITSMGLLKRAHAYKDAEAKGEVVNMGLFDYPVLMASDILLYSPDTVPVGKDQKQHLEITQELARMFNRQYGETFKIPSEQILEEVAVIRGIDGRKMSKSYRNTLGLFDSREVLAKKIMAIVTDSKGVDEPKDPDSCNVFYYHRIFSKEDLADLERRYREGGVSYKESKEMLVENVDRFLAGFRSKKMELDENRELVVRVFQEGGEKARKIATEKLREVREKIGIVLK
jgi:tryptophanyl-tRNA synthetase